LQPAVPKDSTEVPGKKWLSGFFSIGSLQNPLDHPYGSEREIRAPSQALHELENTTIGQPG